MLCMIFQVAAAVLLWLVSRQASNTSPVSEKIRRAGSVGIFRQKAAIRRYLRSLPYKGAASIASDSLHTRLAMPNFPRGFNVSSSLAIPDRSVDIAGAGFPLNEEFMNISLSGKDPAQREHAASTTGVRLKMGRSPFLPCVADPTPNSIAGDRDCEYNLRGRLDDPDSVWNTLYVERQNSTGGQGSRRIRNTRRRGINR